MEIKAMEFYHSDGFTAAYNQASKWIGKNGKIATLPDIIDARIKANKDDVVWNKYYTTLSAEYVGLSRDGKRLIVIAHGIGPMSTLEGIQQAYSWEYKDKSRSRRGGRITQEEFWDLIDGKYGEIEIVDFDDYVLSRQYPFISAETADKARINPLLRARIGRNIDSFISKVSKLSQEWHRKQAGLNIFDDYETPHDNLEYLKYLDFRCGNSEPNWLFNNALLRKRISKYKLDNMQNHGYVPSHEICKLRAAQQAFGWDIERALHLVNGASNSNSAMFEVGGASNCPYGCNPRHFGEEYNDVWKLYLEEGYAYAHLLSIGSLGRVDRGGIVEISIDVDCFEWTNGVRLIGLQEDYNLSNSIEDGPNASRLLEKHWNKCMIPIENPINNLGMSGIMKIDKEWFTMLSKKGERMDTHTPEYRVKTIELINKSKFSTLSAYQGDCFFRFGINEICKIAPMGANAYFFTNHPEIIGYNNEGIAYHGCDIEFYKITVDTSQRLMTASQLENNLDKMIELMELN